jgi:flagellin
MGLRIKTNLDSQKAQEHLSQTNQEVSDSLEKLSSGYRINKSADDSAGLAISENMQAKMRSFSQAKRNASDGMSYLQTAEGGLNDLNNIVIRMRELATQAATDTIGEQDRVYLDKEFQELGKEAIRIQQQTEFDGKKILTTENTSDVNIQVGIHFKGSTDDGKVPTSTINLSYKNLSNFDKSLASLSKLNIQGETASDLGGDGAEAILESLDESMDEINLARSHFGGLQSRLNYTLSSIDVASENLNAAQSRIRDVDYAWESSRLAKNKIMSAAGTSVLSQANQLPEHVLTLLRQ